MDAPLATEREALALERPAAGARADPGVCHMPQSLPATRKAVARDLRLHQHGCRASEGAGQGAAPALMRGSAVSLQPAARRADVGGPQGKPLSQSDLLSLNPRSQSHSGRALYLALHNHYLPLLPLLADRPGPPAASAAAAPATPDASLGTTPGRCERTLSDAYAAYRRGDYTDVIAACQQVDWPHCQTTPLPRHAALNRRRCSC